LIEALSDDIYYARAGAARALGQIGDVRAVEPLIALLRDDREYVRWVAADALRKLGEGAVGPLVRQLDSDKGRGVEMFALVLGHIGDERGVPVLRELAETHPENYVKQTARRALDMIQGRELESSRQPD
jgi:HEAT repeat protein